MHAGELEVSILLRVWPDVVGEDFAAGDHSADDRPMLLVQGMGAYTNTGVIGRPSAGDADKGRALLSHLSEAFGTHLSALSSG